MSEAETTTNAAAAAAVSPSIDQHTILRSKAKKVRPSTAPYSVGTASSHHVAEASLSSTAISPTLKTRRAHHHARSMMGNRMPLRRPQSSFGHNLMQQDLEAVHASLNTVFRQHAVSGEGMADPSCGAGGGASVVYNLYDPVNWPYSPRLTIADLFANQQRLIPNAPPRNLKELERLSKPMHATKKFLDEIAEEDSSVKKKKSVSELPEPRNMKALVRLSTPLSRNKSEKYEVEIEKWEAEEKKKQVQLKKQHDSSGAYEPRLKNAELLKKLATPLTRNTTKKFSQILEEEEAAEAERKKNGGMLMLQLKKPRRKKQSTLSPGAPVSNAFAKKATTSSPTASNSSSSTPTNASATSSSSSSPSSATEGHDDGVQDDIGSDVDNGDHDDAEHNAESADASN